MDLTPAAASADRARARFDSALVEKALGEFPAARTSAAI
jgi:hypothetical protein